LDNCLICVAAAAARLLLLHACCCTLQAVATGIMYVQSGLVTADLVRHPEDAWEFGSICPGHGNALKWLGSALAAKL
jgi:hypothetical protein